jgi:uncharacterized membrane protein
VTRLRLEAFSDGVFAVAITLLVLDLRVPLPDEPGTLGHKLLALWPHYAAYVVSFITIGIIWINHHAMIRRLRVVDHTIMILNLLLLMSVVALPFATNILAEYLHRSAGQKLAAAVYSGAYLVMSIAFGTLNRHILYPKSHLLEVEIDDARRRVIIIRGIGGIVPYLLATILAAVSAYLTFAICVAVAFFYALPIASGSENSTRG